MLICWLTLWQFNFCLAISVSLTIVFNNPKNKGLFHYSSQRYDSNRQCHSRFYAKEMVTPLSPKISKSMHFNVIPRTPISAETYYSAANIDEWICMYVFLTICRSVTVCLSLYVCLSLSLSIYIYIYICVCVCVCVFLPLCV